MLGYERKVRETWRGFGDPEMDASTAFRPTSDHPSVACDDSPALSLREGLQGGQVLVTAGHGCNSPSQARSSDQDGPSHDFQSVRVAETTAHKINALNCVNACPC